MFYLDPKFNLKLKISFKDELLCDYEICMDEIEFGIFTKSITLIYKNEDIGILDFEIIKPLRET